MKDFLTTMKMEFRLTDIGWYSKCLQACRSRIRSGFLRKSFVLIVLTFSGFCAKSQIEVTPTERPSVQPRTFVRTGTTHGRVKETGPLQLPFWDDFSTPFGPYPDTAKWVDSYSVWVNNGMAIDQPTINAATFDGLDSVGLAYNPNEILVTGYTDVLTSKEIDLSETAVAPGERPGVYLSFFYQWQGNGEAPDNSDFLELQFKNGTGAWESVLSIYPQPEFERAVFYDTVLQLSGDQFFHEGFQFRFRSFGRQSGPYDTWNLDYVYLNKGRFADDDSYPERAAASAISPLFGQYTSIPYSHFQQTQSLSGATFDVTNLKNANTPVSINYRAIGTFTNYLPDDTLTYSTTLVQSEGVKGSTGIMFARERTTVQLSTLPDPGDPLQFNPTANAVDVTLKIKVISSDSLETDRTKFLPVNLQINDTISETYRLGDYYAYDDGVAEYAAGLIEPGSMLAYQFDMLVPQDTLIAFQIHFVPYGITSNQTVNFYIFADDQGKPGDILQTIASQRIDRKGLNEFQTVVWLPAVLIDQPRFYIGWKQPIAGKALVGLDTDNDSGARIFVNTNNQWYQNDAVAGSLMIRPVFGSGEVDVVIGIEDDIHFSLYPNPNSGSFYLEGQIDELRIMSITGADVPFLSESLDNRTYVEINKPSGLYLLQYRRGNIVRTKKVIVNR
jgi:hypothetical protein